MATSPRARAPDTVYITTTALLEAGAKVYGHTTSRHALLMVAREPEFTSRASHHILYSNHNRSARKAQLERFNAPHSKLKTLPPAPCLAVAVGHIRFDLEPPGFNFFLYQKIRKIDNEAQRNAPLPALPPHTFGRLRAQAQVALSTNVQLALTLTMMPRKRDPAHK